MLSIPYKTHYIHQLISESILNFENGEQEEKTDKL